ncbi:MAG: GNAT family N-acetyltransferase [Patescibacteria group bacterium]|nr:GNAT family N-acetyltransferase [Patescibacteria group bacterium]
MFIRQYRQEDRKAIERINFETGFMGESMNKLISSPRLWSLGIKHYLDYEPESIFVAEENGQVVGYILGLLEELKTDKKKMMAVSALRNLRFLYSLILEDKIFWLDKLKESIILFIKSLFGRGFKEPKNAGHLHINLLPSVRGKSVGTQLLNRFLEYAKKKGTKIIFANSYQRAENLKDNFWTRNGFKEYSKIKTDFWRLALPGKEIYLVCYVRSL